MVNERIGSGASREKIILVVSDASQLPMATFKSWMLNSWLFMKDYWYITVPLIAVGGYFGYKYRGKLKKLIK